MNTGKSDVAVHLDRPAGMHHPSRNLRQWWSAITVLIAAAISIQAVFAGAMLSGVRWAPAAHSLNAVILIASTTTVGLVAVVSLRRITRGQKLDLTLLSLAAALVVQTAVGKLSANGASLMWVHVSLGVALVGFAALAVSGSRRLGEQ